MNDRITIAQANLLRRLGYTGSFELTKSGASMLIEGMLKLKKAGKPQAPQPQQEEEINLDALLGIADHIWQYLDNNNKMPREFRLGAFRAILDAYTRLQATEMIGRSKRR